MKGWVFLLAAAKLAQLGWELLIQLSATTDRRVDDRTAEFDWSVGGEPRCLFWPNRGQQTASTLSAVHRDRIDRRMDRS